ncbi:MAG: hypothetical protein AAFV29_27215, partial [Myxococcota bacterium]
LGRGRMKGATIDLDERLGKRPKDIVQVVNEEILQGRGRKPTLDAIREQVKKIRRPRQARRVAVTLALGSPEFMSQ